MKGVNCKFHVKLLIIYKLIIVQNILCMMYVTCLRLKFVVENTKQCLTTQFKIEIVKLQSHFFF